MKATVHILRALSAAAALLSTRVPKSPRHIALGLGIASLIGSTALPAEPSCTVKVSLRAESALSFHPTQLHFWNSRIVGINAYAMLFDRNMHGEILPLLAESWVLDKDEKNLTVKLNPSCRWSNGEAITATQMADGIRLLYTDREHFVVGREHIKGAHRVLAQGAPVADLGVEVIDQNTLTIGYATSPDMLFYVLSSPAYTPMYSPLADVDPQKRIDALPVIGSGPYVVKTQNLKRIVLAKNRFFCAGMISNVDELHFVRNVPLRAQLGALSSGRVDVVFSTPARSLHDIQSRVEAGFELQVDKKQGDIKSFYLLVNQQNAALRNPAVKTAIRLAIDHELLQSKAMLGPQTTLARSYAPPYRGYRAPEYVWDDDLSYQERRAQAKSLMGSQGYGPENPLVLRVLDLEEDISHAVAKAMMSMFKGIYIKTELVVSEGLPQYIEALKSGDYDLGFVSWADYFPDPSDSLGAMLNLTTAPDDIEKPLEERLRQSFLIPDRVERFEALADLEREMQKVGGLMPLYRSQRQLVSHMGLDLGVLRKVSVRDYTLKSCQLDML